MRSHELLLYIKCLYKRKIFPFRWMEPWRKNAKHTNTRSHADTRFRLVYKIYTHNIVIACRMRRRTGATHGAHMVPFIHQTFIPMVRCMRTLWIYYSPAIMISSDVWLWLGNVRCCCGTDHFSTFLFRSLHRKIVHCTTQLSIFFPFVIESVIRG